MVVAREILASREEEGLADNGPSLTDRVKKFAPRVPDPCVRLALGTCLPAYLASDSASKYPFGIPPLRIEGREILISLDIPKNTPDAEVTRLVREYLRNLKKALGPRLAKQ